MENLSKITNNIINYNISNQNLKFPNFNTKNVLERVPIQDTVSFNGKLSEEELNKDIHIKVSNGFLGMGKRKIHGTICEKQVDLTLDTSAWNTNKVKLSGTIENSPVNLVMKNYKLSGDLSDEYKDLVPHLKNLMMDKSRYDAVITAIMS